MPKALQGLEVKPKMHSSILDSTVYYATVQSMRLKRQQDLGEYSRATILPATCLDFVTSNCNMLIRKMEIVITTHEKCCHLFNSHCLAIT